MGNLTIAEIEKRMRPGMYSQFGFLGPDESLDTVLNDDRDTLKQLGCNYDEIADALAVILRDALDQRRNSSFANQEERNRRNAYNPRIGRDKTEPCLLKGELPRSETGFIVAKTYQVFITQYRGYQKCPWGCRPEHAKFGSCDFLIINRQVDDYIIGPGLIAHLIGNHHFFEGKESPYRVEPTRLVNVLQLRA